MQLRIRVHAEVGVNSLASHTAQSVGSSSPAQLINQLIALAKSYFVIGHTLALHLVQLRLNSLQNTGSRLEPLR